MDFFINITREKTVRAAAKTAKLTPQHGARLLDVWRNNGWIVRSKESPYIYTKLGDHVCEVLLWAKGLKIEVENAEEKSKK